MKLTTWMAGTVTCWGLLLSPAWASDKLSGELVASKACDAYSSHVKGNNPGSIRLAPGARYTVLEVNKSPDFDWIRIEVPDATPEQRWVSRECGTFNQQPNTLPAPGGGDVCRLPNQGDSYVLTASWQPGFCRHVHYSGTKPECDALNSGELVVDHLTLHGLWPNRQQCGTHYGFCSADKLQLKEETVSRIAPWMPNFYYETNFGSSEWLKHGTCQSRDADDYFNTAVSALQIVDASEIGETIKGSLGTSFQVDAFFSKLQKKYGDKVAGNVMVVCAAGSYLQEIQIHLPLTFSLDGGLGKLIDGTGFSDRARGCGKEVKVEASKKL